MKYLIALVLLAGMTVPVMAKCQEKDVAYYHRTHSGGGSLLADVFLFPFTVAIMVMTVPVYQRTGDSSTTEGAACMAAAHVKHFTTGRPRDK